MVRTDPLWSGIAVLFVLVGCAADDRNLLLNGGGGDGTRYNIALPEPPPIRQDDGAELAPNTGSAEATNAGTSQAGVVTDCVAEINRYRAMVGAAPLPIWSEAEACTTDECRNDAASMRAHGSFGACTELGQNECPGWGGWHGDPKAAVRDCLAAMWAEGPGGGHYENMRRTTWRKVSCAVYVRPSGEVTAIQNFR